MKMHKIKGRGPETYCSAWIDGFNGSWGYLASLWWKYVTCKRCLAAMKRKEKK